MLTRNDKCFFALAFYRQTVQEMFRAIGDDAKCEALYQQASFWWELYLQRRKEARDSDFKDFRRPSYRVQLPFQIPPYSTNPLRKDRKK